MPNSARTIVRDALPRRMADEIWSGQYDKVLPITINGFELSAVLPAVFYMFRFGQRRGRGRFLKTFGPETGSPRERRRMTTVERVAQVLADSPGLAGFNNSPVALAILGDLLLGFNVENISHDLGRDKQLQRVAPAHYMSSWIDLPEQVANLRFVPEMIVAMLADQDGAHVEVTRDGQRTWFPVARNHDENLLLNAFSHGVERRGHVDNLAGDTFDEQCEKVGIDQLLMIRLALRLGVAPDRIRGESASISNQRPISEKAAKHFSEDIRRFVRSYASVIPRHAFVDMLEACISTGMVAIFTSVIEILSEWVESGKIIESNEQTPASIFVDCSNGINNGARRLAEQSLDDLMRRVERLPMIVMMLRLLDHTARYRNDLEGLGSRTQPYATEWLNVLGDLLHGRRAEAKFIHQQIDHYGSTLEESLSEEYPEAAKTLRNHQSEPNPVRRLATALTPLLGGSARRDTFKMVDSILNTERPNGLAHKRQTTSDAQIPGMGRRRRAVRSLVFTDAVLDYLVHLHLLRSGSKEGVKVLSLKMFLEDIRAKYGFHVDTAPSGMTISNELLRSNRMALERRLRDLGLLVGVNDAESMKRLRPRFKPRIGG